MNQAHRQSGAAFDQHAAHTGRNVGHSAASGHAHTDHAGHDKHAGHDPEMFRRRFWLTLALTIPLVVTSEMVMDWFNYSVDLPLMNWYGPVLGSIVFWWGGWPFLAGGVAEVRDRRPGMMLLITMAISVAYVASMATSLDWLDLEFWWELAALVTIMLLGHWQEMKAIGQAQNALAALAALLPDEADLVDGDTIRHSSRVRAARRRHRLGPTWRASTRRRNDRRRQRRARRVDDHWRVHARHPIIRRPCRCRHGVDRQLDPGACRRRRRRHRAGGNPAARRRRPSQPKSSSSARRPLRRAVVLRCCRRCDRHLRRVVGDRRSRHRNHQHGHGVGDRLPPRPRACHPARDRDLDRSVGQGRDPRQGPARPRTDALDRHRAVRQDRHPHQRRPRRYWRRRDRLVRQRPRAAHRCSGRSRKRTSPRPGDRQRRRRQRRSRGDQLPVDHRARGHRRDRRHRLRRRRPGAAPPTPARHPRIAPRHRQ